MKKVECSSCNYVFTASELANNCPVCGHDQSKVAIHRVLSTITTYLVLVCLCLALALSSCTAPTKYHNCGWKAKQMRKAHSSTSQFAHYIKK